MSALLHGRRLENAALGWHHLAERRLAYYTELFISGRWRHYYADEHAFAVRMFDVIKAARAWAQIVGRQTAAARRGNRAGGDDLQPAA